MLHYTLTLFSKDDSRFELRILDANGQAVFTGPLLAQAETNELLALTTEAYRITAPDLVQRGQALFNWLDQHSHGWLRNARSQTQALALNIDVREAGLQHLPWELLHDGQQFLCADPLQPFTPLRRVTDPAKQHYWQPQKRQLGVLFMASSPEDVEPVLDFEAEESGILQATARKPLDLQVEESGSLAGLEERLSEYEDSPDVIHLSGHADIDETLQQPHFLLEDDTGYCAPASPTELARTLLAANNQPRIVFLSGCRTGESQRQQDMLSFSEQLVQTGVPVVLGWALPVGDQAASAAAAVFYDKLATGFDIASAVALTRQHLLEQGSPYWHLLRGYADGSVLNPLVKKGRLRVRRHNTQQQFLDAGGRIAVCARTDFIGRRRLLQRSLRSLRAYYGEEAYAEGVLLYGMGGLGKSSTAARLVDRLGGRYESVVCYGRLDETALLEAIGKVIPGAQSLLNDAQQSLEQRLRYLFEPEANAYCEKPLLLIFDDFEQNIPREKRQQAQAEYDPESLRVLHTVLQAIRNSQSDTRIIITSRFDVTAPVRCHLHKENPQTLHNADLRKKLAQLPGLQITGNGQPKEAETDALRQQAITLAAGNPRLLEWLDSVLQNSGQLPVSELFAQLEDEEAKFREDVLITALVEAQSSAVRHTLACAALYQLPVTLAAITALTDTVDTAAHLQAAGGLGLVEISQSAEGPRYFVSNLLDTALVDELSAEERQSLAAKAARYLFEHTENDRAEMWGKEIVRLAIKGKERDIAIEVGDSLTARMMSDNRYREVETLARTILTLGEEFRLLTSLARAQHALGQGELSSLNIERAVHISPVNKTTLSNEMLEKVCYTNSYYADILQSRGQLDDALDIRQTKVLPNFEKLENPRLIAVEKGKIADILQARGQLDEALNIREQEELPVYEKLGDVRSKAVTMGQIADILQARGQLDEALNIRQTEQLPVYEKLGDVRSKAVTMGQIADILHARGQLDEALNIREQEELPVYEKLGDVRSKAVTMGKIADILHARGQLDEALNIRQTEQLPVYEKLGDVRSKAVTMGKIADILHARGQLDEALNIREQEELPVYEKLGDVRSKAVTMGQIADILQARGQLDEALNIRQTEQLPVYEKLGDVRSKAVTMGKIADILQARGQLDEALNIRQTEQLPVYEKLGDVRSKAVTMGKIADILHARGQLDEALNIREQEELPVYEKLGDVRSKAVTMGKIADILHARGQLDEALNIREQEELPVYEKLGDVRSKAVTMGKIADILHARGQLDEALNIREQEELPVYEKLGDVRSKAVTMGQIADILQARGQLDEALNIREQEELPVYEKLGDVRSKAVTMGKIADILQARGQLDEALNIRQTEQLPVYEKLGDVRSKAVTMGKIADILQARGQLDEALNICEQEELPVYEKLGDVRSLLVGRTNLAMLLWQINATEHVTQVQHLLCVALEDAQRLQIPEAGQIESILAQMGLSCTDEK